MLGLSKTSFFVKFDQGRAWKTPTKLKERQHILLVNIFHYIYSSRYIAEHDKHSHIGMLCNSDF